MAQCYLGHGVMLGSDTKLYPQVSLRERVRIGDRCIIHNGTVIGSDGSNAASGGANVPTSLIQVTFACSTAGFATKP